MAIPLTADDGDEERTADSSASLRNDNKKTGTYKTSNSKCNLQRDVVFV
jgi:hypothetical protein